VGELFIGLLTESKKSEGFSQNILRFYNIGICFSEQTYHYEKIQLQMIYVYKTSVKSQLEVNILKPHFVELIGVSNWNFDLEDCDNILRLEIENEIQFEVISLLKGLGFDCEELPD
jgi:hypothetical protein